MYEPYLVQATHQTLGHEMTRDSRVVCLGEDVGANSGYDGRGGEATHKNAIRYGLLAILLTTIAWCLTACSSSPTATTETIAEHEKLVLIGEASDNARLTRSQLETARQWTIGNLTQTPGSRVVERSQDRFVIDAIWTKEQLDKFLQAADLAEQNEWPDGMRITVRYAVITAPSEEFEVGEATMKSWIRQHDARILSEEQKELLWMFGGYAIGHDLFHAQGT